MQIDGLRAGNNQHVSNRPTIELHAGAPIELAQRLAGVRGQFVVAPQAAKSSVCQSAAARDPAVVVEPAAGGLDQFKQRHARAPPSPAPVRYRRVVMHAGQAYAHPAAYRATHRGGGSQGHGLDTTRKLLFVMASGATSSSPAATGSAASGIGHAGRNHPSPSANTYPSGMSRNRWMCAGLATSAT